MRKIVAALALFFPLVSHAWWSNDWNYRKEITLDLSKGGANIQGTLTDVPVLVRLHLGNFGYFADTKPDGSDFRAVAGDDKTPLKLHIERYDATNQLAYIWVRVPQITGDSAANKFYLYYGNPKAPAVSDAASTYDTNQVLVYHFGDEATPTDHTAYANKAAWSTAVVEPASLIGAGVRFNGSSAINIPSSASLRLLPDKGLTLSAWVRMEGAQAEATLFELADANRSLVFGVNGTHVFAKVQEGGRATANVESTEILKAGQWHLLAITAAANKLTLYVDGIEVAATAATLQEIAGTLSIGASNTGSNPLNAELDELQIYKGARGADWLRAAASGQGQESTLISYGPDAQREGQSVNYFATTMANVTPDGWVVIIILAVMFVIAMLIMISKAVYLLQIKKANNAFLKEFAKIRGDTTALDRPENNDGDAALDESPFMPHMKNGEDRFRMSTVYRLYHHGVQEMSGRVAARSVGAAAVRTLNQQTMNAIRAALDATSVRLTQKLSARMVLLTIAISGGPFLGLLGTVVGVMITFAAIAASGDVNVNAIAPGIAAALAATVAGLAVAIPALFGYNWLNTQIKEISADMRVFIDEFVTRVAEEYS